MLKRIYNKVVALHRGSGWWWWWWWEGFIGELGLEEGDLGMGYEGV
jgi:hypothetical protein